MTLLEIYTLISKIQEAGVFDQYPFEGIHVHENGEKIETWTFCLN